MVLKILIYVNFITVTNWAGTDTLTDLDYYMLQKYTLKTYVFQLHYKIIDIAYDNATQILSNESGLYSIQYI